MVGQPPTMLNAHAIQQACGGQWHGEVPLTLGRICSDSRSMQAGDMFLALRGPHFDGHAFAAHVADRAAALIGDHAGVAAWQGLDVPWLEVADTMQALADIARAQRDSLAHCCVIAITGSYGKTTVRAMLAHGFRRLGLRVAATEANNNNLIGVPQTLLAIPETSDIALVECGISEQGEMARLAAAVSPDLGVLTGVCLAHGEGLGTARDIAAEKIRLFEAIRSDERGIIGASVAPYIPSDSTVINAERDGVQWSLDGSLCRLQWQDETATVELPLPAEHWAQNMALVATVMQRWAAKVQRSLSLAEIATALSGWSAVSQRMQSIALPEGRLLLDDAYNANPASMQAALDTFMKLPRERLAILGDMAELGASSEAAHRALDVHGADHLVLIGTAMQALAAITPRAHWFKDTDSAARWLSTSPLTQAHTILVKGSRCMHVEQIVTLLT
ncbi:MAG: UDP-N-acetylmuramoyl-tripeptide--D-alanyl-D-alanine ligase [Mariprofundaceae bacterium]|nr:UDP-N-acetylmuramoyl-tripeptide--D-alanyl-D-alanine ligase [Mariprofundaceae bacterium]